MSQTGFSLNNLGGPSLTSLLDASADASDQARQHLKSVRARLAHAIQDYVAACELLLTVCHASTTAPAQRERSKLAINAELLALAVEEARLRKAREVLTEARGQCRMVSPIQLLPSEILARIFLEAACHCTHEITYKYVSTTLNPVALSGVCRQWRQVAIGYRPLWTHIDLVVSTSPTDRRCYSPKLWKERSQDALLYVNIRQYRSLLDADTDDEGHGPKLPDDDPHSTLMFRRLLNFLSALIPQVCSTTIVFCWSNQYIINQLLDWWTLRGTTGQAKVLQLQSNLDHDIFYFHPEEITRSPSQNVLGHLHRYKKYFESLKVLHLHNVTGYFFIQFPLANLTDLRLQAGEEWGYTQNELASVLSLCVNLQCLSLDSLDLCTAEFDEPTCEFATLKQLQTLYVKDLRDGLMVEAALTLIHPGPSSLTVGVSMPFNSKSTRQNLVALHSFVSGHNVRILHVSGDGFDPFFASQLGSLPHVETLVLDYCHLTPYAWIRDWFMGHFDRRKNPDPVSSEVVLWPSLQNLYLNHCVVDKYHIRQLLSAHAVQSIYLWDCFENDEPPFPLGLTAHASKEYWQFLPDIVPQVVHFNAKRDTWPSILH